MSKDYENDHLKWGENRKDSNQLNHPSCIRCKHFFITWEKWTPKGCRLYGIKSMEVPSQVIRKTTGQDCLGFVLKKV